MKQKVHPRQWPQRKVISIDKHSHVLNCGHKVAILTVYDGTKRFRRCYECHKAREK